MQRQYRLQLQLFLTLVCFVCFATRTLALSISEDGHYDTRYNHLDIERILNNKRLVNYYAMCLLGQGTCTPQGTEFKRILPEALRTNCIRCTEKQKVTAYLAIRRLKKEYPKIWQQLQAKWDPKGEYVSTFVNTVESSTSVPKISLNTTPSLPSTLPPPSSSKPPSSKPPSSAPPLSTPSTLPVLAGRFADLDNEISPSLTTTKVIKPDPTLAPVEISSAINNQNQNQNRDQNQSSTTTTTTLAPTVKSSGADDARSTVTRTTVFNYRNTNRPNKFNILLPRPDLGLRLTANWIGSIGDIGSKVIKTGARIADMVISSVHATIG